MTNHTIQILGKPYEVRFEDDTSMGGMMGTSKASAQVIRINTNQADENTMDTILHEILHVIDRELGIGLEERDIQCLAVGLFSCSNIEIGEPQ